MPTINLRIICFIVAARAGALRVVIIGTPNT
jgi:hypothetical protein